MPSVRQRNDAGKASLRWLTLCLYRRFLTNVTPLCRNCIVNLQPSLNPMLYLNHNGEDQRPAVEIFEDMAFGNISDYSPDVYPVCDMAFLIGKHFFYVFL